MVYYFRLEITQHFTTILYNDFQNKQHKIWGNCTPSLLSGQKNKTE